jgi:hypothetical protein
MSGLEEMFPIKDVAPKVGIGGVLGKLEDGQANDAKDKRPSQQGMASGDGAVVLRHGRKIPVAARDKSFLFANKAKRADLGGRTLTIGAFASEEPV